MRWERVAAATGRTLSVRHPTREIALCCVLCHEAGYKARTPQIVQSPHQVPMQKNTYLVTPRPHGSTYPKSLQNDFLCMTLSTNSVPPASSLRLISGAIDDQQCTVDRCGRDHCCSCQLGDQFDQQLYRIVWPVSLNNLWLGIRFSHR